MCRIAYFPPGTDLSRKEYSRFYRFLEATNGGFGSGIGWFDSTGKGRIVKGVGIPPEFLALRTEELLRKNQTSSGVIFHTRIPTIGAYNDHNCQPFKVKKTIMAYNGTWRFYNQFKLPLLMRTKKKTKEYKSILRANDGELIAILIQKFGFDIVELIKSGVIVTMYPSKVKLRNGIEKFGSLTFKNGKIIYASEFPSYSVLKKDIFNEKHYLQIKSINSLRINPHTTIFQKS